MEWSGWEGGQNLIHPTWNVFIDIFDLDICLYTRNLKTRKLKPVFR